MKVRVFLILLLASYYIYPQNLVRNPSFESGTDNEIDFWYINNPGGDAVFERTSDLALDGTYSASIKKTNSAEVASWVQDLDLEAKTIYNLIVNARAESEVMVYHSDVQYWINGEADPRSSWPYNSAVNDYSWGRNSINIYISEKPDSAKLVLSFMSESGKVFFDQLSVTSYKISDDLISISCGADQPYLYSSDGKIYYPDREYTEALGYGYINSVPPPNKSALQSLFFGGVETQGAIYEYARYGFDEYRFDLPDGHYAVFLHFCENEHHDKEKRVMNISIEGEVVLNEYDVFAEAGRAYVITERFLVDVQDGQLNIGAQALLGNTMVSAISVERIEKDEIPPRVPLLKNCIGGYDMNILDFSAAFEADLKGFNIYRDDGNGFNKLNNTPFPISRYIDRDVKEGKIYTYKYSSVDLWGNESKLSEPVDVTPISHNESTLPVYNIQVSGQNLNKLNDNVRSNDYVDCSFEYNGTIWNKVKLRYRGNATRVFSKKGYKLKFIDNDLFEGQGTMNLISDLNDPSLIRNFLTYSFRKAAGVLTQDVYPVHLNLNGEFIGVYFFKEQEDDDFPERHNLGDANIYRSISAEFSSYDDPEIYKFRYEKENNDKEDYSDLIEFLEFVNESEEEDFINNLPTKLNVGEFLTSMAVINFLADVDQSGHNYLLLHYFHDDRWSMVNWDHNLAMFDGSPGIALYTRHNPSPIGNLQNRLFDRMFEIDEYRYYYLSKLWYLTTNIFSEEAVNKRIDSLYAEIVYDAYRDIYKNGWENNDPFDNEIAYLKNFLKARLEKANKEIPLYMPDSFDPFSGLVINEIQPVNTATYADKSGDFLPWIEFHNKGLIPLNLTWCSISNDTSDKYMWRFPIGPELEPGGHMIVWADSVADGGKYNSTLELEGSGTIFLYDPNGNLIDSVNYQSPGEGKSYGRTTDGAVEWRTFDAPSPGLPNGSEFHFRDVVINEFMTSNSNNITDERGENEDWIELYNRGRIPADISGYYLSDRKYEPRKWMVPETTILDINDHLLVWADGDTLDGPYHASFKLSRSGEAVFLFSKDGHTLIDSITYSTQETDKSMGRNKDGSIEWIIFDKPTPGFENYRITDKMRVELSQNYPNPFKDRTYIDMVVYETTEISLRVFDSEGRFIRTIVNSVHDPGEYKYEFNSSEYSQGTYYIQLRSGSFEDTKRMMIDR